MSIAKQVIQPDIRCSEITEIDLKHEKMEKEETM